MSKLKVKKLESTNKKPLQIIGDVIFSGNVTVIGNLSGGNTTIISSTTITNENIILVDSIIPLKPSVGENSFTQKGDSEFYNFGKNSSSLGDFNKSNGDFSSTIGNDNITGSKDYDFIKVSNKNYLIIVGENVVSEFAPKPGGGGQIQLPIVCTGSTLVSALKSYIKSSRPYIDDCYSYTITNNQTIMPLTISYTDCETNLIKTINNFTNSICSKTLPTYTIPPQYSAFTSSITNGININIVGSCCKNLITTSAITVSTKRITTTATTASFVPINTCLDYTILNPLTGHTLYYTDCSGTSISRLILTSESIDICSRTQPTLSGVGLIGKLNGPCQKLVTNIVCTSYTVTERTIVVTTACSKTNLVLSGECVTYRFLNNSQNTNINNDNIFWTDCYGINRSEKLLGYRNYFDVCAIKNSAYGNSGITISQIYSGCCVSNTNMANYDIIHNFSNNYFLGQGPFGTLLVENGIMYGTTYYGGQNNNGTIFSCNTDGSSFGVMADFRNQLSGIYGYAPYSGLFKSSNGLFYGTTLFSRSPSTFTYGFIYSFNSSTKQLQFLKSFIPYSGISTYCLANTNNIFISPAQIYAKLMEPSTTPGVIYGISYLSAYVSCENCAPIGTILYPSNIFKYDIASNNFYYLTDTYAQYGNSTNRILGGVYAYTQLFEFSPGILYGTCSEGGLYGGGTIFKFQISSNTHTIVHNFNQLNYEGKKPTFTQWAMRNGILYGTCSEGGLYSAGTIFSFNPLSPIGTGFNKLFDFPGGVSIGGPRSILFASDGLLYGQGTGGVIANVSSAPCGHIFSYNVDTGYYDKILDCNGFPYEPCNPYGTLVEINGKLYGTSYVGGSADKGTVFTFELPTCTSASTLQTLTKTIDGVYSISNTYKYNATSFDGLEKSYFEVVSITTGYTTPFGTIHEFDIYDLPQNVIYSLLEINPDIPSNNNFGKITTNNFGESAVASGIFTQAKGTASISKGISTTALGNYSHAEGYETQTKGDASHAGGINSVTNHTGEFARSSGMFNTLGDAQYSIITTIGQLSGDTISYLYVDGLSENIKIKYNSIYIIELDLNGIISKDDSKSGLEGEGFTQKGIVFLIKNDFEGNLTITDLGKNRYLMGKTNELIGTFNVAITAGNIFEDYSEIIINVTGTESYLTSNCIAKINITKIKK